MADFPAFSDYFGIGRNEALARNTRLTRDAIDREGSDANVIVAGSAAMADEVTGQLVRISASIFLDSAKGKALDRLVFDRYGLLRKPAAPAFGTVDFSTAAPNPLAFTIPVGTKISTNDGRQYATTAPATFPFAAVGPISVPVRSVEAGASQQASVGTINNITSGPIPNAPADLRATNSLATAGASDGEKDDELRTRARGFWNAARRGTIAALENGALAVPGVQTAKAFEILDEFGRPAKQVQLAISDAFTATLVSSSPTPAAYQTQSQALASAVFTALYDVRAAGIYVNVFVAIVELLGVQLGLAFKAGFDPDTVAAQARASIASYINALSPGASFVYDDAIYQLRLIEGLEVSGNEILSPTGDVIPQPLQVLRSSQALVVASQR